MAGPELLNVREVAALLRGADKTAYTLAQGGDLPGFKVGGQWRFRRRDIDAKTHRATGQKDANR